jgi:hypothetical protein
MAQPGHRTPWRFLAAAVPVVFLFVLYQHGLNTFFFQDDFAWLSLLRQTWNFHDFLHSMFAPMAQGTVRPLSERGFFMLMQKTFGMDSYPFHLLVFLTMSASLLLSSWVVRRLTGSTLASFLTPFFWAGNAALVTVMTWNSSYNEALCSLCVLGALALFIRFAETGRRSLWWAQFGVFVIGFGALEINIVYPALAAAWVVFLVPRENRRKLLLSLWPLALTSVIYFAIHRAVAPLPGSGPYQLHIGPGVVKTLAYYWQWTVLPNQWFAFGHSRRVATAVIAIGSLSAAAILCVAWRRKAGVIAFCIAWYLITLAPILPLSAHRTDYYLTIPLFGFATAAAMGVSWAWSRGVFWAVLAALPSLIYFGAMLPVAWAQTLWWEARAENVRVLIFGVQMAKKAHPNRAIVLDGLTSFLYDDAVGQSAFYPLGIDDVYLTPGSELNIHPGDEIADIRSLVLEPAVMYHALTHDQIVVYSFAGDHLRNITGVYEQTTARRLVDRLPGFVDVGNPLYSWLLGPSWSKLEFASRWMPDRATVKLGIPENGNKLQLEGYLPIEQLKKAQRHLKVTVAGFPLEDMRLNDPESNFHRLISLPVELKGRSSVELEIRVDPVISVDGETRGLVFGKISVIP